MEILSKNSGQDNIPYEFLFESWKKGYNVTDENHSECSTKPPSPFNIKVSNKYWQVAELDGGATFYAFGAYYDDRPMVGGRVLRILGMSDVVKMEKKVRIIPLSNVNKPWGSI